MTNERLICLISIMQGEGREICGKRENIFHSFVCFTNGWDDWSWARLTPGAWSSICISHVAFKGTKARNKKILNLKEEGALIWHARV